MAEYYGDGEPSREEKIRSWNLEESNRCDREAHRKYAKQGFFKKLFTSPKDYRPKQRPYGDGYYNG